MSRGPMRVVFLDFDGVLNSQAWMERQTERINFLRSVDPAAVAVLAEIVRRAGAEIVVSSTWRINNSLADLRGVLIDAGFPSPCPIRDRTPRMFRTADGEERVRGHEIQAWIDGWNQGTRPVESFVILDDDSDMAHLLPRLVQTSWERGLLPEHVEPALHLLATPIGEPTR